MKKDELAVPKSYAGVNAIFARGFTEYYLLQDREKPVSLRECQDAGLAAVKSFDQTMSVTYISKIARQLKEAGIFSGRKEGRRYFLTDGPLIEDWENFLFENEDYGSRLTGNAEQDDQRMTILQIIEDEGAIRANGVDSPIPSAAYKLLSRKVKEGLLDIVFVEPELVVGVKHEGKTKIVRFYPND